MACQMHRLVCAVYLQGLFQQLEVILHSKANTLSMKQQVGFEPGTFGLQSVALTTWPQCHSAFTTSLTMSTLYSLYLTPRLLPVLISSCNLCGFYSRAATIRERCIVMLCLLQQQIKTDTFRLTHDSHLPSRSLYKSILIVTCTHITKRSNHYACTMHMYTITTHSRHKAE